MIRDIDSLTLLEAPESLEFPRSKGTWAPEEGEIIAQNP